MPVCSFADEPETYDNHLRKILCISSYALSNTTVSEQIDGLQTGLGDTPYRIDFEFMDAANHYSLADVLAFKKYISYKLTNGMGYDLLILCDDNALRFWFNNKESLFGDMPMIFLGVNNIKDAEAAADMIGVSGVAEVPDYLGTLELMHQLFPERTNVVAVVDGTYTGHGEYAFFEECSKQYDAFTYQKIITNDYSTDGLKDAIQRISDDSMILYLDFTQDADGKVYSEEAASELLYDNAPNIPIFRTTSPNLGHGVLGGKMYSSYDAGKTAGEMARDFLTGQKKLSDIPIVEDPVTEYMFDYNIMHQYGIRERDLPIHSTIINEPRNIITFYKENTTISNLILVVIFLLIGLIAILALNNRKREQIINTDFLTQMPNRLYIQARISAAMEKKAPFGILMMDVDHFKTINDTLGHGVGDELLIGVASRLKALSSSRVIFARIGGDEFMALITGSVLKDPTSFCEQLIAQITEIYSLSSGPVHITASVGLAIYPDRCKDIAHLQEDADLTLYHVKEHGRNGFYIYDDTL